MNPTEQRVTSAGYALIAARQVLAELADDGDATARGEDAEVSLQRATEAALHGAHAHLKQHHGTTNEGLASFLATLGAIGAQAAADWTASVRAWREGFPSLAPGDPAWVDAVAEGVIERFSRTLAIVTWRSSVRADVEARRAERERQEANPAGAIVAVAHGLARTATPQLELGFDDLGAPAVMRPDPRNRAHGTRIAIADPPALPVAAREVLDTARALQALGSQYALPVAECLIDLSQTRQAAHGVDISAGGARLRFDTWAVLAQHAMGRPERPPHPDLVRNVRLAAWAWARTPIRWPDGIESSALWTLDDELPRPGAPVHGPVFTLSERAQWGATQRARQGRRLAGADWENVRIVPLPRPRIVPPAPGSNRTTYGPQAAFLRLLWVHFTRSGHHLLAPPHGIPVTAADVAALAEEAQLATSVSRVMLGHYVASRVIEHIGGDLFVPADAAARAFIAAGWQRSEDRRRAGRRGASKRAARGATLRISGTSDDKVRTSDGRGGNLG